MTVYDETAGAEASAENGWFAFGGVRSPFWAKPIDDGDEVETEFGTLIVTAPAFVAVDSDGGLFVLTYEGFLRQFISVDSDGFISPLSWVGTMLPSAALFTLYDSAVANAIEVGGMPLETMRRIVRIMQAIVKGTYWEVSEGEYAEPSLPVEVIVDGYACLFDYIADPDAPFGGESPYGVAITPPAVE